MDHSDIASNFRIRLYWSDIEAALAQLRSGRAGNFRATIDGNFPVIVCENKADAEALLTAFPKAKLIQ